LSFLDIMKQEMQMTRAPHSSSPMQKQHQPSTSPGPGPNPWLRGAEDGSKSPQQHCESSRVLNFMDIVADEKKQRENWSRMRAKPQTRNCLMKILRTGKNRLQVPDTRTDWPTVGRNFTSISTSRDDEKRAQCPGV
jgi:hypothetical protein